MHPSNQLEQWAQGDHTQQHEEEEKEGRRGGFETAMDTDMSEDHSDDITHTETVGSTAVSSVVSPEDRLLHIAEQCSGYSGRSLRKLPLKAHAMYLQRKRVSLEQYLNAIAMTIEKQKQEAS